MSVEVGETLRLVREAKGLKQKDVAVAAEVSIPFLALIEKGCREPSLAVLRRLAVVLDVPVEALILASQPKSGSFRSIDARTRRIAESVQRLKQLQDALKRELESQDANSD